MKLLSLDIEKFMTIGEAKVSLSDRGLVLIQGRNEDDSSAESNGAGKSTLLNALCWVLYGETAHGLKADQVVNRKSGKGTRVCATVEDDGKRYSIVRHRKHPTGKNHVQVFSEDGEITKGTDRLTQEMIVRLFGCSKDVFLASIYASQEGMADLPGMTDKNLKAIVEEAAGIDRLTRAYDIARDRHNTAATRLASEETKLESTADQLRSLVGEIKLLKDKVTEWDAQREERKANALKEAGRLDAEAAEYELSLDTDRSSEDIRAEIERVKATIAGADKHRDLEFDARGAVVSAESNKDRLSREYSSFVEAAKKAALDARGVADQVGKPCGECGKPYGAGDLDAVCSNHKKRAGDFVAKANELKPQIEAADKAIENAKANLEKVIAARPDTTAATEQISKLNNELLSVSRIEASAKVAKDRAKDARAQADSIARETNPYLSMISTKQERAKELRSSLGELKANVEVGRRNIKELAAAREVFSPKGVRNHILEAVTPFLNERTAHYLNALSDGAISAVWQTVELTKKGESKDKFGISVNNVYGADSFAGLSGGEKRKVRIATTLALQDLVASRATKNIELFVGDEIDDALDESGLERLMGILEEKAIERGTVMVISHNDLKSWIRQTITVVKKDGQSRMEEA
ncbi:exonuclease [Photobacterium ganghwense]|uniref:Rad50/SbcC-type AAA domain-containing protein n=1 Tax=Photobacterium ganghwense TaxID=320778 RepID=A0A0J1K7B1_9GAMM|nr:AAA family ATPase [Photobacterium ganghwense]KLV10227.1 hypothetical protein ABT57_06545 [Photobacterium ganghwense]PSU09894.1 exonuclease [Photobacterium ganghwense]